MIFAFDTLWILTHSRVRWEREHNLILCSPIRLQNTSMSPLASMGFYYCTYYTRLFLFFFFFVLCLFVVVCSTSEITFIFLYFRTPHSIHSCAAFVSFGRAISFSLSLVSVSASCCVCCARRTRCLPHANQLVSHLHGMCSISWSHVIAALWLFGCALAFNIHNHTVI